MRITYQEARPVSFSKHKKAQVAFVAAAVVPLFLLSGCSAAGSKAQKTLPPLAVQVQTVGLSNLPVGSSFLGSITPYIQTTLAPGAQGSLASVNVRPGQVVHQGEVLATLSGAAAVPAQNAAEQAGASLTNAQVQYQDALALYNDHLSADQQVANAQSAVNQQKAALQTAQVNLQKAQVQEQAALGGGSTPQDLSALQAVLQADQQQLTAAQKQLDIAQSNEKSAQDAYTAAQQAYGNITADQVTQAAQKYQQETSYYQSWQSGGFAGQNPYTAAFQSAQSAYQALNTGYNALQTAKTQYNSAVQAVSTATAGVASAQAQLASAQKNMADANPASGTNAAQQAKLTLAAAQAAYNQTKAQYDAAVSSLNLAKQMAADRTQEKQALDQASNTLRQNQVSYQTAQSSLQVQLQNGQVISPISGVVQSVGAQVGQSVGPQTQLITLASDNPVMATVDVPPNEIAKMKPGVGMSVDVPNLSQTFSGRVLDVHPQLDASTNEYPVDVIIDGEHPELLPGLQVEAQLTQSGGQKVILVPADAVLSLQSGAQEVFVLNGNKVHSRIVQVGDMTSTQYEITGGLKVGDKIVVQGQNLLSDGDTVKVVPAAGAKGN